MLNEDIGAERKDSMNAVYLSEADNVATVTEEVPAGASVSCSFGAAFFTVTARQAIPIYHKIAVRAIGEGESVLKYGEKIGVAQADIRPGDLVHTHNLASSKR
jgi:altronate dehydratase